MNSSKKLMKKTYEAFKKKKLEKYRSTVCMKILTVLPAFEAVCLFSLQSIIDISTAFSLKLAVLSFFTTLFFEIDEWNNYFCITKNKEYKILRHLQPSLSCIILFIFVVFILDKLNVHTSILEKIPQMFPNLIAAIALMAYFISNTVRSILMERYNYLTNEKY